MIGEIFKAVMITSLAGSAFTLLITLARPITKKLFGYLWHYYIWLAVLLVMALPVQFGIVKSESVDTPAVQQEVLADGFTEIQAADGKQPAANAPKMSAADIGTEYINKITDKNYPALIWLTGTITLLFISIAGYLRSKARIRRNSSVINCPKIREFTDKKITVRLCRDISSPFMIGVFRPALILPDRELSGEALNNILRHEMMHFKRRDILYKWFAALIKCVHWFNPAAYYISRQISIECEISCDLAVTARMNNNEVMSYINTILSLLSGKNSGNIPLTTGMAGSKSVLRRRFIMIRNRKKTSKIITLVSAAIALIVFSTTVFASGVFSDMAAKSDAVGNTDRPAIKNLTFSKEGETEQKQASLVLKDGYSLYLPEGEWRETGADRWAASVNEQVQLWTAYFENGSEDRVMRELIADGYKPEDREMTKQEEDIIYKVKLNEAENGTWAVFYCYPTEAAEGFGSELPVIADTFEIRK